MQRAGWYARVRITNSLEEAVWYAVQKWSIEDATPDLDTSNSEGKTGHDSSSTDRGFSASVGGLRKCKWSLTQATFDDEHNPFAAPLAIKSRERLTLIEIFPDGDVASSPHRIPHPLVLTCKHEGEVAGLQPTLMDGTSDGQYLLADEP